MATQLDNKDALFVAQNSGAHAAQLVAAMDLSGLTIGQVLEEFNYAREAIYNGALGLAGVADPEALLTQAFPGTTHTTASDAQPTGFTPKLIKDTQGSGKPDWLDDEWNKLVADGKVDAADSELWDNRDKLPKFGGSGNPRAPWFRTSKGKVSIWPPKGQE